MLNAFKLLFRAATTKTETNTFHDDRLGKLTCEFNAKEPDYFFWETETKTLNKNKEETTISIDGTRTSPDMRCLERVYWAIDAIEMITDVSQQEVSKAFPKKGFDLRRDFVVDDISTFIPEDDDESDVEIEFYSDDFGMLTVEFKDGKFLAIDYIE
jgi:hypothetical protein